MQEAKGRQAQRKQHRNKKHASCVQWGTDCFGSSEQVITLSSQFNVQGLLPKLQRFKMKPPRESMQCFNRASALNKGAAACPVASHANSSQVVSSQVSVNRCPLRVRSTARRDTFWAKLEATEESRCLAWP